MNILTNTVLAAVDYNVEFPGLGIEGDKAIKISRTAFSIGSISVRWYGIIIACGMLLCFLLGLKACKKNGLTQDDLIDYLIVAIPSAIVGARLYYVIFNFGEYKDHFADVFKVWEGGLAIYGGLIGAFIGVFIMSKYKKHKFLNLLDFAAPYLLLGQGIGRWGNFFNQEAYGCYTNLPWGMTSENIRSDAYILAQMRDKGIMGIATAHPTFLYESIICLIGFALLLVYREKWRKNAGECICLYMMYYGLARFFIEGLRTDSLYIGSTDIRVSQVLSAALVIIGIALFIDLRLAKKHVPSEEKQTASEPEEPVRSSFAGVVDKIAKMEEEEKEKEEKEKEEAPEEKTE